MSKAKDLIEKFNKVDEASKVKKLVKKWKGKDVEKINFDPVDDETMLIDKEGKTLSKITSLSDDEAQELADGIGVDFNIV